MYRLVVEDYAIFMKTLFEIIELLKREQGKGFIMDETGEISYAIVPMRDFERMVRASDDEKLDAELINHAIVEAQLSDHHEGVHSGGPTLHSQPAPMQSLSQPTAIPRVDLREEVIDPSFNFDAPQTDEDL